MSDMSRCHGGFYYDVENNQVQHHFLFEANMKKTLRFGFVINQAEKDILRKLAELDDGSQAVLIRRLIRCAAFAHGFLISENNSSAQEIYMPNHLKEEIE